MYGYWVRPSIRTIQLAQTSDQNWRPIVVSGFVLFGKTFHESPNEGGHQLGALLLK